MKRVYALGVVFAALTLSGPSAPAQEMPQPTAEHQRLAEDVGEWQATLKMWMGPGEPMQSEGTETVSMVGPFWQVSTFDGTFMGQPFQGTGWMGWDPAKKQYVSAWIDSMTPTISHGTATWNEAEKAFVGTMTGIGPDGSEQEMETVVAYPEEGKRVFTLKPGGQPGVEITYVRK